MQRNSAPGSAPHLPPVWGQHGGKESNRSHPIYILFKAQTNTTRKHAERGKIDKPLRDGALKVATEL